MTHTQVFRKQQGIVYGDRGRTGRLTRIKWALIVMRAHQQLRHQAEQHKKRVTYDTYGSI
jgi:hypothetical protein